MAIDVDPTDLKIIEKLTENARAPVSEIANALNVPRSTVAYRIRQLEQRGILRGYTARPNHAALGRGVTAFLLVHGGSTQGCTTQELAAKMGKVAGVEEVHVVAGEWDLLLKLRAADNAGLLRLVQKLHPTAGSSRTMTLMTFMTIKEPI